jgi:hypothetical protein
MMIELERGAYERDDHRHRIRWRRDDTPLGHGRGHEVEGCTPTAFIDAYPDGKLGHVVTVAC